MSSANSLRVLELESQSEVLERLQLLANFGSSLITVTGTPGAGKTWIAQRYLEAWADEKNQALLMCYPNQDEQQHRTTILSQISPQAYFDPSASLSDSLFSFYEDESCNIVIVVDDAQLLSETLISELWMLVLDAQGQARWSVNVILFSLPNLLDTLLTRLSYGQEHKPVDVEIDTLTDEDADRFFEFYVMRYIEPDLEKKVRNAYSKVRKTPGEIMALGEQKMEKRVVIRSIIGSPVKIAIFVVLLLVLIGGGYYWMLKDGLPEPSLAAEKHPQTAIPTLPQQAGDSNQAPEGDSNVSDDSNALPPQVTDTTAQVGVADTDRKRVIISSDVVDALMDGEDHSLATPDTPAENDVPPPSEPIHIDAQNSTQQPAVNQTETEPVAKVSVTEKAEPVTETQIQPEPTKNTPATEDKGPFDRDTLLAMSERSYTLQLGAFNTLAEVNKFMNQYQLTGMDNVYIYPTLRNNVQWIIVAYDNYPTIQVARDAVETLSPQLQRLGPWAKSLRQVHREIEHAK